MSLPLDLSFFRRGDGEGDERDEPDDEAELGVRRRFECFDFFDLFLLSGDELDRDRDLLDLFLVSREPERDRDLDRLDPFRVPGDETERDLDLFLVSREPERDRDLDRFDPFRVPSDETERDLERDFERTRVLTAVSETS